MNILITGGLGYVGGRIADYLKKKEHDLCVFLTTRDKSRALPSWTDRFVVLQMDLLNGSSVEDCLKGREIDVVIHLAALNEVDSMKDPVVALKVNTEGTYRLLDHATCSGVKRFIYFSTFHVYGVNPPHVITEATPTRASHPYAITHRAAEDFVNYFGRYDSIETLIFRLSNSYGYPMHKEIDRWTLVFNDLCKQAVTSGSIVLKSSGRQHRDFISLHDVGRAVHHFLFAAPDKWGDGLVNLGGDCSMSILDAANAVADVYKKRYGKDILELRTGCDNDTAITAVSIDYAIDKITQTGFSLEGDMVSEIERTLSVCEGFVE